MSKHTNYNILVHPITRAWSPNLAFQYRMTAEQKRRLHRFHRFKNYKERVGRPVEYYADPLATDEIRWLRSIIVEYIHSEYSGYEDGQRV